MNLKEYNEIIYNEFKLIREKHIYSNPLLVSPSIEEYKPKIMYIGQETNGWGNGLSSQEEIEQDYENYYYNLKSMKLFWKFIKNIYDIDNSIQSKILWCNTLIAGKINKKGKPDNHKYLTNISVEYLTFLYKHFEIEKVVIVCGPNEPYYSIIKEFISNINLDINIKPSLDNQVITTDKLIWTYHPVYQNKQKTLYKNIDKIKK